MSKKQLGAAAGDEPGLAPAERPVRFRRLRAQPGFRTAAVAFVLTVVLGIGSTVAYAYWNQTGTARITGSAAQPPLPVLTGDVQCYQPFGVGVVRIIHPKAAALPAEASILASVLGPGNQARTYAVPNDGTFNLRDLPGLSGSLSWSDRISVSVTTAYLNGPPKNLPALVDGSKILQEAAPAAGPASAYYLASFFC